MSDPHETWSVRVPGGARDLSPDRHENRETWTWMPCYATFAYDGPSDPWRDERSKGRR